MFYIKQSLDNLLNTIRTTRNNLTFVSPTETTVLGEKVASPICIAPTAMQRMAHNDGECATSKAAAR